MTLLKTKLLAKKSWLLAKKFWWIVILVLGLVIAFLIFLLTKNGAFIAALLDLMEIKNNAHDQEMETLAHVHNTEITEKNTRLKEHFLRREQIKEEYEKRGEELSKEKEAELKKIVDESYNDPEKLAQELAEAFGIKNG
tara:strand:- start:1104 stop:1520 length:417 start_codon:yes stop_codon:yes gene_type:complete